MNRFLEARPRKGFTLTEVLMAMFVMAIGMISLLALFPAAFQQAKWALDSEQVARAAANAQSMTEVPHMQVNAAGLVTGTATSVRNDDNYRPAFGNNNAGMPWKQLGYNASTIPAIATELGTRLGRTTFLVNYDTLTEPTAPAFRWTFDTNVYALGNVPNSLVKLPPVFVDPLVADLYIENAFTNLPYHVGADLLSCVPFRRGSNSVTGTRRPLWSVGIPRFSLSRYKNDVDPAGIRRTIETSMGDEINFDTNGQPLLTAGQFARQQRFTWAYLCQWPDYNTPDVCEVTAVMFNSRPQLTGLSATPPGEVTYTGTIVSPIFTKGLTQATIILGTSPQPINTKVGDWVMDSTFILPEYDPTPIAVAAAPGTGIPPTTAPFLDRISTIPYPAGGRNLLPGLVGGHFYKILDISAVQGVSPNLFQTITIDRPAKSDGLSATFIAGIADVITKSVGRMPQR